VPESVVARTPGRAVRTRRLSLRLVCRRCRQSVPRSYIRDARRQVCEDCADVDPAVERALALHGPVVVASRMRSEQRAGRQYEVGG